MKRKTFLLVSIILFLLSTEFTYSQIGYDVERRRVVLGSFKSLKVFSGLEVKIIPSDLNKIYIYGDNKDNVIVSVKKEILKIKLSLETILNPGYTYVELYYKDELNTIDMKQGTTLSSKKIIRQEEMLIKVREGSKVDLNLVNNILNLRVASGGQLDLKGESNLIDIKVTTGGVYNGQNLISNTAKVNVIAGGRASLKVSKSINASVTAGGIINVYGNPKTQRANYRFGGRIHFFE
jgi:hypothetical protein